jgi:hypothetical protein
LELFIKGKRQLQVEDKFNCSCNEKKYQECQIRKEFVLVRRYCRWLFDNPRKDSIEFLEVLSKVQDTVLKIERICVCASQEGVNNGQEHNSTDCS